MCKSCSSTQIMRDIALISRKIYTAGTNFTRPPVVTVATNLNSACVSTPEVILYLWNVISSWCHMLHAFILKTWIKSKNCLFAFPKLFKRKTCYSLKWCNTFNASNIWLSLEEKMIQNSRMVELKLHGSQNRIVDKRKRKLYNSIS